MHIYYRITVKPDYRWANVRVSGRDFSKASIEELNEAEVNEEILNSPLLAVEKIEPEPEPEPGPEPEPEPESEPEPVPEHDDNPKPRTRRRKAKEGEDG